eukprot:snap_masked-scaffold_7-processed-gene-1.28-mRNA-1 protein AED:1.00 eAED:1.00 QI:0/0/0/0/1/1/2/0/81
MFIFIQIVSAGEDKFPKTEKKHKVAYYEKFILKLTNCDADEEKGSQYNVQMDNSKKSPEKERSNDSGSFQMRISKTSKNHR